MDAQGGISTFERSSFNSSNNAMNNNELPRQDCRACGCINYGYTDNNNMTCYGFGHDDFSPNLHHHMTARGSNSGYERAVGNHAPAGAEGPSGGTGWPSLAIPSEPAIASFFAVSNREEPMPQAPPVNNVNEQPVNLGNNNQIHTAQQRAQQRLRSFLQEMLEDVERALETLDALEDDDETAGTEDDADDEDNIDNGDEDEDEDDITVGEDDDLVGTDFEDDDDSDDVDEEVEDSDGDDGDDDEAEGQNGNEGLGVIQEAPGNSDSDVNVGPFANNIVAMQPEEGDGLDMDDILAALGREVYEPQPHPDELHPHLVGDRPPSCSICLDDFEPGELLGFLECYHKFHYICVQEWLSRKNSCPLCRNVGLWRILCL